MKRTLIALLLLPSLGLAASLQCMMGITRCIKSQGTEITSKQAIRLLDLCAEFTRNDLGRMALRMTFKEAHDRSGNRLTPLVSAWLAFEDLDDSPLVFERKRRAEDINYMEIKRSCQQLERDFYDDSKWTK